MLRDEVLALLKQREGPLSGETMSKRLGVSRAAVWKAVEALRQEGYVISSAPNRGYRLETSPDLLSAGELSGACSRWRHASLLHRYHRPSFRLSLRVI